MRVTRLWLPIQECLSWRQCGGTEEHRASAGPCAIQVKERRGEFGPRVDHKSRQAVNYGNHKNHGGLRVSAVKAVLLVVIDVEDGNLVQGDSANAYKYFLRQYPEYKLTWLSNSPRKNDFKRLEKSGEVGLAVTSATYTVQYVKVEVNA